MLAIVISAWSSEGTPFEYSHVEKIPKHPNVVITAPTELIGASLTVDGINERTLWPDTLIDRPRWRSVLHLRDPKPKAAKVYVELQPGKHILVISKAGYQTIVRTIVLRDEQQQVKVGGDELIHEKGSD
ncbi:MAG: hypothetical protein M3041_15980 [Acidobacteriota bacterium]|nr:hypothetical protein [Acidobacteriota bacterium]